MVSTVGLIILSAFAALGIYYFVLVILEIAFSADIGNIVTIVPVSSDDKPVNEVLRAINNLSSGSITILVDLSGAMDTAQYIEKGLCAAATTPEKLGEMLGEIIQS